ALIAGIAGGIMVVMNDALIIDTIIHYLAELLKSAPNQISAQLMLVVQTLINLPICSSTGQAAVTMPIMAPLGDALNISRDATCLIYQLASGLTDLVYPVSNIVIVCGLCDIKYETWLKWVMPLVGILFVAEMGLVSVFLMLGI
ncbi:MAG: YfcC family protein, partial [Firmicutes bacterium]|nr:YfcC family protein [Bacillota bacterium]